ncbi:MAG TPA: hypothetical protein VMC83_14245 [Streptosporangiaceae bacterium]|nr:hypothetical protein [Streptosporangiaceae bacterium]
MPGPNTAAVAVTVPPAFRSTQDGMACRTQVRPVQRSASVLRYVPNSQKSVAELAPIATADWT